MTFNALVYRLTHTSKKKYAYEIKKLFIDHEVILSTFEN